MSTSKEIVDDESTQPKDEVNESVSTDKPVESKVCYTWPPRKSKCVVPKVPVVEVPVVEVPVVEVPVTEAPVTEVPVTEVPVTEDKC